MGAAAGGGLAPKALSPLGWAADGASIYGAYKKDGVLGGAAQTSAVIGVDAAGLAGGLAGGPAGSAAAQGAAQGAVDYGKFVVAPWLGNEMFLLDQKYNRGRLFEPGK